MNKLLQAIWPRPERCSPAELAKLQQDGCEWDARIQSLQGIGDAEAPLLLEAARRITEEEDKRKAGAEARATTYIAAVAALIPLMTWAIGNAAPSSTCSPGGGCFAWTAIFVLAVIYFLTAAHWALKTLSVANYHVIGVEDLVQINEQRKNLHKILIQQTLLQGRRNRDTINLKLTFIKVAQRRFFNGLVVLGALLMLDPASRLGLIEALKNQLVAGTSYLKAVPSDPSSNPQTGVAAPEEAVGSELRLRMTRQLSGNASQRP